jgi:hypothetical protein
LAYLGMSLLPSIPKASLDKYHLSVTGARVITYSFVLLISAVYAIGFYGSYKMKTYSNLVRKSKEGWALNCLSLGLLVLVFAQILVADSGVLVGLIVRHRPSWLEVLTILNNYFTVLATLISMAVIAYGAVKLRELVTQRSRGFGEHTLALLFIVLSAFYSYLIIIEPIHTPLTRRLYFMPNILIILTIAIPYLIAWYMGFLAAYRLYTYQRRVKGAIYRSSLIYVAVGIAAVVMSSIAVRFLATISNQLNRLKLTPVLFIIYGLLVLIAIGFLSIAWGAKKLRRIEEV